MHDNMIVSFHVVTYEHYITLYHFTLHVSDGTSSERTAVYRSPMHARDDMPPSQSAHEWKSEYQRNFTPITFVKEPR